MKTNLIDKRPLSKGTKTFIFEKNNFEYTAGQYIYLTLPSLKHPDKRGPTRTFTLSTSPTEDYLAITTQLRSGSGFKKTLDEVRFPYTVEIEGPQGLFVIKDKNTSPNVFITGGIGITPARSIIKYNFDQGNEFASIFLIYSAKNESSILFYEEFENIASKTQFGPIITLTENHSKKWTGEEGRIDEQLISKALDKWMLKAEACNFFLSGPPQMVDSIEDTLLNMQVNGKKITLDKFTGY